MRPACHHHLHDRSNDINRDAHILTLYDGHLAAYDPHGFYDLHRPLDGAARDDALNLFLDAIANERGGVFHFDDGAAAGGDVRVVDEQRDQPGDLQRLWRAATDVNDHGGADVPLWFFDVVQRASEHGAG